MSRSYKHTPYAGDKKSKFFKRYFNRKLRRNKLRNNYKYNSYKKDSCSWDICDYYWIETKNFDRYYQERINKWLKDQSIPWRKNIHFFPTREEVWKEYQKYYIRK